MESIGHLDILEEGAKARAAEIARRGSASRFENVTVGVYLPRPRHHRVAR